MRNMRLTFTLARPSIGKSQSSLTRHTFNNGKSTTYRLAYLALSQASNVTRVKQLPYNTKKKEKEKADEGGGIYSTCLGIRPQTQNQFHNDSNLAQTDSRVATTRYWIMTGVLAIFGFGLIIISFILLTAGTAEAFYYQPQPQKMREYDGGGGRDWGTGGTTSFEARLRDEDRDVQRAGLSRRGFVPMPAPPTSVKLAVDLGRGLAVDPNPYAVGLAPYPAFGAGATPDIKTVSSELLPGPGGGGGLHLRTQNVVSGPQGNVSLAGFSGLNGVYPVRVGPGIGGIWGSRSTTTELGFDCLNIQFNTYAEGPSALAFGGYRGRGYAYGGVGTAGGGVNLNIGPFGVGLTGRLSGRWEQTEGGGGLTLGQLGIVLGKSTTLSDINQGSLPYQTPLGSLRQSYGRFAQWLGRALGGDEFNQVLEDGSVRSSLP
jgi:hypothetical protein